MSKETRVGKQLGKISNSLLAIWKGFICLCYLNWFVCPIKGEIGQEATVQPEGILLSRDKDKIENQLCVLFIGSMPEGGGSGGGEEKELGW